jgi:hypothetical protein
MRLQNFSFSVHYATKDCTSATAADNSGKFCALVKAKSNTPVVCVLTDNAKQFVAGDFVSRNAKGMLYKMERHVSAEGDVIEGGKGERMHLERPPPYNQQINVSVGT